MKFHVHLYRVTGKAEIDIDCETQKEAMEKALIMKDSVEYGPAGFSVMAQAFKVEVKENGKT